MRALTTILLSVALTTTAPAWAGSDSPTPYTLTPAGIEFPTPLVAHGHVNIRLTDGTTRGLHFDPNNGHPGAAWIGATFLPWTALGVTSGCIAWVQWSDTNEHYGEGGQAPVCVTSEEPSWTPTVPTSTAPSTPSPTTPTAPSPTTPTPTRDGSSSPTTSAPSPSSSSTPTPSSTPSTTPSAAPSPEDTTTPPTPTETPWTTPSPEAPTPSTQPTSAPSSEAPDGSDDPSTSDPSERGTDAATPSPSASASAELPVTGPSSALLGFAGALTLAGLAAVALGRRTR